MTGMKSAASNKHWTIYLIWMWLFCWMPMLNALNVECNCSKNLSKIGEVKLSEWRNEQLGNRHSTSTIIIYTHTHMETIATDKNAFHMDWQTNEENDTKKGTQRNREIESQQKFNYPLDESQIFALTKSKFHKLSIPKTIYFYPSPNQFKPLSWHSSQNKWNSFVYYACVLKHLP